MRLRLSVICGLCAFLSAVVAGTAWIVFLPRIISSQVAQTMTGCTSAGERCAPAGTFAHKRHLPAPGNNRNPYPNPDALTSSAWADLSDTPLILHVPAMGDFSFSIQLRDAWTEIFGSISNRQNGAGDYLIAGPDWKGDPPAGIRTVFRSSTDRVWIVARVLVASEKDSVAANLLQDQFSLKKFEKE